MKVFDNKEHIEKLEMILDALKDYKETIGYAAQAAEEAIEMSEIDLDTEEGDRADSCRAYLYDTWQDLRNAVADLRRALAYNE